jgi:Zn-dependent metalloprotease
VKRRMVYFASAVAVAMTAATLAVLPATAREIPAVAADPAAAAAAADAYVAAHPGALFKGASDTMVRTQVHSGTNGLKYTAYERTYRGLRVVGGDAVVVTDAAGRVRNTAAAQTSVINVGTTPSVSAEAALATSRGQLATVESATAPQLVVLAWGTPRLVWETVVTGATATAPSKQHVFVDALTGKVADSYDEVRAGTGTGFYNSPPNVTINTSGSGSSFSMADSTRPGIRCGGQNGATFTGTDDVWGNGSGTNLETACVDALYAVQREWDMLGQWLGRNGINGSGSGFPIRVGLNQANAFWNGSYTNFGRSSDGQRQAVPMDVVAHEFGHAIFQTTPGGSGGNNETGGLNEATGDIFGALTEFFANNPNDPPDFLVGEEVNLVGSGPIRNMYNPSALGDPNCWSTAIPNTEVHAGAGPLNHWFTLLSQGSGGNPNVPTCNGSTVTGVGIQNAGRIYYNAMLAKTSSWTYARARLAAINAAVNLFGANSAQCTSTKAAWNAISVPVQSGEPACGGTTTPPTGTTVFSDDFEIARGWTAGTNTATTGLWERANPEATTSGVTLQLGTTVSGSFDLVTEGTAGASAGVNDVDGGTTTINSPSIALPAGGTHTLSFSWYLAHLNNATSADFFRVSVVSGANVTQVFQQLGAASNRAGAWATASVNISSFAGQTITLRIEAADAGTASLIEAGVDNVLITRAA